MIKRILFWLIQLLCWSFIAFVTLQYSPLKDDDFSGRVTFFTSYLIAGLLFGYIYTSFIERLNSDEITTFQFLFYPTLGALSIGIIFTFLDYTLGGMTSGVSFLDFITLFFENIWLILPCFFFFHLYRFTTIYQDGKQRTLKAETQLQISELENLKKQLNPHFLFNALNSIKALTLSDSKQARESIIQLSDLLRLSLNLGEQQRATLGEELKLAQNYLALEKLRFDNRLMYEFNIQADLDNVLIMPMSLNTLLENAVKHGIGQLKSGGKIIITVSASRGILTIQVENTGSYDPKPKSSEGGIGLENLHKRLALQYAEKASLTIKNENEMVKAVIKMPF
ncbi:MAG: histidine kinase [Arcicella sp.]|nr:histidine kinase [Arcicella sp.]